MDQFPEARGGSILVNTLIIVVFLVATGTAFLKWSVDENYSAQFDLARTQAYYTAQEGVLREAFSALQSRPIHTLPKWEETFPPGDYLDENDVVIGRYHDVRIKRETVDAEYGIFDTRYTYKMRGQGTVEVNTPAGRKQVTRGVYMRARLRTYASYMYLTRYETTRDGNRIWFWDVDVLNGRVHSNDWIAICGRPEFYGPVSTSQQSFIKGNGFNPYFAYPPRFNAPEVFFPETAQTIRDAASNSGHYYTDNGGMLTSRIRAMNGNWLLEQWMSGLPYDSTDIFYSVAIQYGSVIFIEGDLQVFGENIAGYNSVGCSSTMWLMDNICYADVNADNPDVTNSLHILGLISEGTIKISDTWVNGRGGSLHGSDITITAALVALDQSFTIEHPNDSGDNYIWCSGDNYGSPDERGRIRLRGSLTQVRRGYVHLSNCGGTGYYKDYTYDFRLETIPPPCFISAIDSNGNPMFEIIEWKEESPDKMKL